LPLVVLGAACTIGGLLLSSCGGEARRSLRRQTMEGVPPIRVLLTRNALRTATLFTTGRYDLNVDGTTVVSSTGKLSKTRVRCSGGEWSFNALTVPGRQVTLRTSDEHCVGLGDVLYRGSFRLIPVGNDGFQVINYVDLESYLAGVLPKELPREWSEETYAAQGIAARTYALYQIRNFGASHDYDVGANQDWQVYGGRSAETAKGWKAVDATRGTALGYGPKGQEEIFMAQYSACCGGYVNGAYVIRNASTIEPLRGGQICVDCTRSQRHRWGPVRISKQSFCDAIAKAYPSEKALGGVKEIRTASETPQGRAVWVDVIGTNNTIRLRAEDMRLALVRYGTFEKGKLHSMNCRIRVLQKAVEFYDGRGLGHGVGLCQWGAQGKAERGWTYQQILEFYYPGAKWLKVY
jgi:stage II sporulation protein D